MTAAANRRGRPAMLMLSGCFMLSAALRAVDPAIAFALEAPRAASAKEDSPADVIDPGPTHSDLAALLAALRERERQLDEREERIAVKTKVIEAAEAKLRDQMKRLEEAESRLGALLRMADSAADKDIGKLVAAFETMSEKRAGPIFENMDVAFAAGLLSRMTDGPAAAILGALTPEKAYAITVFIASQNARAPKE